MYAPTAEHRLPPTAPATGGLDSSFTVADPASFATKTEPPRSVAATPAAPASPPGSEAAFPQRPGPVGEVAGVAAAAEEGPGTDADLNLSALFASPDPGFFGTVPVGSYGDVPMNLGLGVSGPDPDSLDFQLLDGMVMQDTSPSTGPDGKEAVQPIFWENMYSHS